MSDEQQPLSQIIHLTEPGAWNWLAALFPHLVQSIDHTLRADGGSGAYGAQFHVARPGITVGALTLGQSIGRIAFNRPGPDEAPATAVIISATTDNDAFWEEVIRQIQSALTRARALRRTHEGVSTSEAVEIYYRARAAGARTTLKDLAEQYNLPLGALKTAKRRYDAAGKWGSSEET